MISMQPLIRLEAVTKKFLTDEVETHALAGIHLEINSGEWVSISGPSGCGKSTLLSILGLLDSPSDGGYWLNDRPVEGMKMGSEQRDRLTVVESDVRALASRVAALERELQTVRRPAPPPVVRVSAAPPVPRPATRPPVEARVRSLEEFLGGRVLAWAGGSAGS